MKIGQIQDISTQFNNRKRILKNFDFWLRSSDFRKFQIFLNFRPLTSFLSTIDISSEIKNSERGDSGLSFKWSKKFLPSKLKKLFNFENWSKLVNIGSKSGKIGRKNAKTREKTRENRDFFVFCTVYVVLQMVSKF